MKYTPVKRQGQRGRRNAAIKNQVWRVILRRTGYKCEACRLPKPLEWAHIFGRPGSGFCLGPIANSRELTMALCRECHNGVDRGTNPKLANELRWRAMGRLVAVVGSKWFAQEGLTFEDGAPYEGIRVVVTKAEEAGWHFDEQRCELVKGA